jgi:hypothetical protein
MQIEASVTQFVFEDTLNKVRSLILQDVGMRRLVPRLACVVQALDVPTMALHEKPVERISHSAMIKIAVFVLGERQEHRVEGGLQSCQSAPDVSIANLTLDLVKEGALDVVRIHLSGFGVRFDAEECIATSNFEEAEANNGQATFLIALSP